jgi:hypothetical protein
MATVASLLSSASSKDDSWSRHVCDLLERYSARLPTSAEERAELKKLIQAAYNDATFCHCYLSVAQEVEDLLTAPDPLDAALEELGAKPYHPIYAPLPELPGPMSAATKKRLLVAQPPEKPDMHGCAYADSDCPWSICYMCEYEKGPQRYYERIRSSNLVMLISAYFKSPAIGERAKGWSNEVLEAIVAYLDTPIAERGEVPAGLRDLAA